MKTNNLNSAIDWYSNTILPNVSDSFIKLSSMLSNANISEKEKAHILLVGAQGWPKDTHQWYLKIHLDIYNVLTSEFQSRNLWKMPLYSYSTFEQLYHSLKTWMERPYIQQLTIYDVATRIVIAQNRCDLLPKDFVYIHAKPRAVYGKLLAQRHVAFRPKGWNTVVPTSKLPEFGTMAPYYIEDLLCQIGKGNCPFMIL